MTVGDPVDVSDLTPRCNCKGEDQAQVSLVALQRGALPVMELP